ncbi:glycosyltransferase family 4 protein [Priestia megaterium]|uniref:glycosyltransferase family 4 protein n=1 Tax=Priestia megaterium TaxID=1404 RepID=UPI0012B704DA|nr:glycosyltransferase family 4 protein [Priestia megaterium]
MKVIQVGPYPPPMGGISVHIKRIKFYLEKQNIDCIIYNELNFSSHKEGIYSINGYKSLVFRLLTLKADIFHFHTTNKMLRLLLSVYKFSGKKVILTIHGESLNKQLENSNLFLRFLLINSLKKIDKIICVNSKNTEQLYKLGFKKKQLITIPAYIHPQENRSDFQRIPNEVWEFIKAQEFLICANGNVRFHREKDLYGIDMMIELVHQLNTNNSNVSLIFTVLNVTGQNKEEKAYYKTLKQRIINYGLENKIFLYEAVDTELYPILKHSHLFVRPTNVDGFGVSIAEAIFYNVPSIASDVCKRPEGTILFESRNLRDLYEKVYKIINNYSFCVEEIKKLSNDSQIEELIDVYKEFANKL